MASDLLKRSKSLGRDDAKRIYAFGSSTPRELSYLNLPKNYRVYNTRLQDALNVSPRKVQNVRSVSRDRVTRPQMTPDILPVRAKVSQSPSSRGVNTRSRSPAKGRGSLPQSRPSPTPKQTPSSKNSPGATKPPHKPKPVSKKAPVHKKSVEQSSEDGRHSPIAIVDIPEPTPEPPADEEAVQITTSESIASPVSEAQADEAVTSLAEVHVDISESGEPEAEKLTNGVKTPEPVASGAGSKEASKLTSPLSDSNKSFDAVENEVARQEAADAEHTEDHALADKDESEELPADEQETTTDADAVEEAADQDEPQLNGDAAEPEAEEATESQDETPADEHVESEEPDNKTSRRSSKLSEVQVQSPTSPAMQNDAAIPDAMTQSVHEHLQSPAADEDDGEGVTAEDRDEEQVGTAEDRDEEQTGNEEEAEELHIDEGSDGEIPESPHEPMPTSEQDDVSPTKDDHNVSVTEARSPQDNEGDETVADAEGDQELASPQPDVEQGSEGHAGSKHSSAMQSPVGDSAVEATGEDDQQPDDSVTDDVIQSHEDEQQAAEEAPEHGEEDAKQPEQMGSPTGGGDQDDVDAAAQKQLADDERTEQPAENDAADETVEHSDENTGAEEGDEEHRVDLDSPGDIEVVEESEPIEDTRSGETPTGADALSPVGPVHGKTDLSFHRNVSNSMTDSVIEDTP